MPSLFDRVRAEAKPASVRSEIKSRTTQLKQKNANQEFDLRGGCINLGSFTR